MKPGRPARASADAPRIDPAVEAVLLAAARRNYPKRHAADLAGISRNTLYAWLEDDHPECQAFAIKFRKAMAEGAGDLISTVQNGRGNYNGDPKYLLGAVHRIKEAARVEHTGKGGGAIGVRVAHNFSDDEIERELERRGFTRKVKP